jgi:hypothetical protein
MICISDFGSGQEQGKCHAPNYSDSHSDTVVDRRSTDVAVFKWLGLLSWRRDRSHSGYRPYIGLGGTNIAAITDQNSRKEKRPRPTGGTGAPSPAFAPRERPAAAQAY